MLVLTVFHKNMVIYGLRVALTVLRLNEGLALYAHASLTNGSDKRFDLGSSRLTIWNNFYYKKIQA